MLAEQAFHRPVIDLLSTVAYLGRIEALRIG